MLLPVCRSLVCSQLMVTSSWNQILGSTLIFIFSIWLIVTKSQRSYRTLRSTISVFWVITHSGWVINFLLSLRWSRCMKLPSSQRYVRHASRADIRILMKRFMKFQTVNLSNDRRSTNIILILVADDFSHPWAVLQLFHSSIHKSLTVFQNVKGVSSMCVCNF